MGYPSFDGDMWIAELGPRIRARRKELRLTLRELSRDAGISLGYLSQVELGKHVPKLEALVSLAAALGWRLWIGDDSAAVDRRLVQALNLLGSFVVSPTPKPS